MTDRHCDTEPPTPRYYPLTHLEIAIRIGKNQRAAEVQVMVIMNKLSLSRRGEIPAWVALHRPA